MRLYEIYQIHEKEVQSSWIIDVKLKRNGNGILTLNNGSIYIIQNLGRTMFDKWHKSPSKGQFYHQNIKGKYLIL
jgi:hypothetical protein